MLINFVFLLHTAIAFVLAFVLLFLAQPFTEYAVEALAWPSGPLEKALRSFAQLIAVGLVLIGIVAHLARVSGYSVVRWTILISMVAIGLAFIGVSLFMPAKPLCEWVFWTNVIFVALYVWVWIFRPQTV